MLLNDLLYVCFSVKTGRTTSPDVVIACMSCVNTASDILLESLGMRIFRILHRLKQPEYQCYRTKIGTAKNIETLEQISAELKSLLLVCSYCVIVMTVICIQFCLCTYNRDHVENHLLIIEVCTYYVCTQTELDAYTCNCHNN